MRVLKQKDQSFLAGVCGLQGKLFFTASALLCFDLEHPETLLPEKELWDVVKARVLKPTPTPFDTGMPKPQAEVLVHGSCHAQSAHESKATRVRLHVGEVDKSLYVFGPRHWEKTNTGWEIRHDTTQAAPLPLHWNHAFGGPDYADNPEGTGHAQLKDAHGGVFHPLPRIENPAALISEISDTPAPAGMAPVDQMRPARLAKAGTYNETWLKQHWPTLPPDFDMRFFNTAPEDQQLPERYWRGDEAIHLEGMHAEHKTLSSRLPGLRVRCFATLLDAPNGDRKDLSKAHFQELKTHLDTVWLFPDDLRGVLCFRGLCEIKDDEYRDVANVLLVTESLQDEEDRPLEYYRGLRDTWVERTLKLEKSPLEQGQQAVADALEQLKTIPAKLQKHLGKATGKTPVLPRTPDEQFAAGQKQLDNAAAMLDKLEALALNMRAKHGHMANVDLSHFSKIRQNIATERKKLAGNQQKCAEILKEVDTQTKAAHAQAVAQKAKLNAKGIQTDFDPDDMLLPPKEKRWPKSVLKHLAIWQLELLKNTPLMERLYELGLTDQTIKDACLGLNPAPLTLERKPWGLEPEDNKTTFSIPPGLAIPQFYQATPVALRLRALGSSEHDEKSFLPHPPLGEDVLIPGSKPYEEASLLMGSSQGLPLVCASDPLDALLLRQETGDLCAVLLCSAPNASLDKEAKTAMQDACALLVAITARTKDEANKQWLAWHKAKPDATRLEFPYGGPCAAKQSEKDLREILRSALPPDLLKNMIADEEPMTSAEVKPGMPLPIPNIKELLQQAQKQVSEHAQAIAGPIKAEAMAQKEHALAQAADRIRKLGLDPEHYLKPPLKTNMGNVTAIGNEIKAGLSKAKATLAKRKKLTPEIEAKLAATEQNTLDILSKAAKKLTPEGEARMPGWVTELRASHGLDPETGEGLSRERVVAMLENGTKDFRGKMLSGLDLSCLDFSGTDLSNAICMETNFSKSILNNAILHKSVCRAAIFTQAQLHNANLEGCVLQKAIMAGAELSNARCFKTLFAESDCNNADFSGADLTRSVFIKANLSQARFYKVKATRALFKQALLKNVEFLESDLAEALLLSCCLADLNFSGLNLRKASFVSCDGENVRFEQTNLNNARFSKGCSLPGASFAQSDIREASALECSFPGADFSRARMDKALLQDCDLTECSLFHARARQARLTRCTLEKANMRGLDLLQGSLRKSRIVEADLTHANLFGVDFFKTVVGSTIFDLANTKRSLLEQRVDLLGEK